MHKYYVSWQEIDSAARSLVTALYTSNQKFDWVYGIPRGGLIPATIISHKLSIPLLTNHDMVGSGQSILVCDDISDTGKTFHKVAHRDKQWVKSNNVCYTYLALFMRKDSSFKPDYIATIVDSMDWLIMPWERDVFEKPESWNRADCARILAVE